MRQPLPREVWTLRMSTMSSTTSYRRTLTTISIELGAQPEQAIRALQHHSTTTRTNQLRRNSQRSCRIAPKRSLISWKLLWARTRKAQSFVERNGQRKGPMLNVFPFFPCLEPTRPLTTLLKSRMSRFRAAVPAQTVPPGATRLGQMASGAQADGK